MFTLKNKMLEKEMKEGAESFTSKTFKLGADDKQNFTAKEINAYIQYNDFYKVEEHTEFITSQSTTLYNFANIITNRPEKAEVMAEIFNRYCPVSFYGMFGLTININIPKKIKDKMSEMSNEIDGKKVAKEEQYYLDKLL